MRKELFVKTVDGQRRQAAKKKQVEEYKNDRNENRIDFYMERDSKLSANC